MLWLIKSLWSMASDLMKQTVSISYAEVFLSRREEQGE